MPRSAAILQIEFSTSVNFRNSLRRRPITSSRESVSIAGTACGSRFLRGLLGISSSVLSMIMVHALVASGTYAHEAMYQPSHSRVAHRQNTHAMLKPVELEIELFCRGMRMDPSCHAGEAARRITRTRAGLGSGLEIVIPTRPKDIWVNVPVVEKFAQSSPFVLIEADGEFHIGDTRTGDEYAIAIPPEPSWYSRRTSSDVEMSRIGVLQGNYLGIYVSARCLYWANNISLACKFCTTGKNVGTAEESRKRVEDVIEVARAAREESGAIFTHFNTGYHYEDQQDRENMHGLRMCEPYVAGVRRHVGGFIGVQAVPVPRRNFYEYDA